MEVVTSILRDLAVSLVIDAIYIVHDFYMLLVDMALNISQGKSILVFYNKKL